MSCSAVLVDADWVQAHLGDPGIVPVEVDDSTAYDEGHIRGAVKLDWSQDLRDPATRGFVDLAGFEAVLSERGIASGDTVILYGGPNNWFAAYAYLYFKFYGHRDVRLLDGGREEWELHSRELVTEVPRRPATAYHGREQDRWIRELGRARRRGQRSRRRPWLRRGRGTRPVAPVRARGDLPAAVEQPELTAAR
jgi:thiosulfate/3-mercaptopyruvate sulfurtransferase